MTDQHRPTTAPAPLRVLRVDSSARMDGSVTRGIAGTLIERLTAAAGSIDLSVRDLAATPPALIDADWVDANFTDADQRTPAQRATLAESDALVAELAAADVLVIGVPIYNFGIPAALKAWVDMVARARLTFRYTEQGPEGLLRGKRAYLVVASGGTAAGSAVDFATGYLRHVLGFLGIVDVEIIAADRAQVRGPADTLNSALARIDALLPTGEAPLASAA